MCKCPLSYVLVNNGLVITLIENLENQRRPSSLPVVGFDYDGSSYMRNRYYFLCILRSFVYTYLSVHADLYCTVQSFLIIENMGYL